MDGIEGRMDKSRLLKAERIIVRLHLVPKGKKDDYPCQVVEMNGDLQIEDAVQNQIAGPADRSCTSQ
jgi:hypothetical protein